MTTRPTRPKRKTKVIKGWVYPFMDWTVNVYRRNVHKSMLRATLTIDLSKKGSK